MLRLKKCSRYPRRQGGARISAVISQSVAAIEHVVGKTCLNLRRKCHVVRMSHLASRTPENHLQSAAGAGLLLGRVALPLTLSFPAPSYFCLHTLGYNAVAVATTKPL